jgi:hypothetical protein
MKLMIMCFALVLGFQAQAQEWGLTFGVSESGAAQQGAISDGSEARVFGFRLGADVAFDIAPQAQFRTGFIYAQRHFDFDHATISGFTDIDVKNKFDYLDIPALIQYNFNPTVGFFGGLIVAINVGDDVEASSGGSTLTGEARDTKTLIPLLQIGVNGKFNNQIGLEAYYEMGTGDIYTGAKNFSVFGANFIYWL